MSNKNEPSGEVYTSANSGIKSDVIDHPVMAKELKDSKFDLHEKGITHVLSNEEPPAGSQPMITYKNGKKVAIKDINGMTGEKGRYYIRRTDNKE